MPWKAILTSLQDVSNWKNDTLPIAEIEEFVSQNSHDNTTSGERVLQDLVSLFKQLNIKPEANSQTIQFINLIVIILPCVDASGCSKLFWDSLFKPILYLEQVEVVDAVTKILECSFKQGDSKSLVRELLEAFVATTTDQWRQATLQPTRKNFQDPGSFKSAEKIIFAYGMEHPLEFYELLNEMTLKAESRLDSFLLLKTFLILDGAPTYYLIDSVLFDSVVMSCLLDVSPSVFLTAISILTILMPIVAFKAVSRFSQLIQIFFKALVWENAYLPRLRDSVYEKSKVLDKILVQCALQSVERSFDEYFTVLYGMFPQHVMQELGEWMQGQWKPENFKASMAPVLDPFDNLIDNLDFKSSYACRIKDLIHRHRLHPESICSLEQEFTQPWFLSLEASETMLTCFELRIIDREPLVSQEYDTSTFSDLTQTLLKVNNSLHGYLDQEQGVTCSTDNLFIIKVFYYILLNESFSKECMRQYHMMHIKRLRKRLLTQDFQKADKEAMVSTINVDA